jgi:hypothetical protein
LLNVGRMKRPATSVPSKIPAETIHALRADQLRHVRGGSFFGALLDFLTPDRPDDDYRQANVPAA